MVSRLVARTGAACTVVARSPPASVEAAIPRRKAKSFDFIVLRADTDYSSPAAVKSQHAKIKIMNLSE